MKQNQKNYHLRDFDRVKIFRKSNTGFQYWFEQQYGTYKSLKGLFVSILFHISDYRDKIPFSSLPQNMRSPEEPSFLREKRNLHLASN